MKLMVFLLTLTILGSQAFAGSRTIYCDGKIISSELAAKGSRPYGSSMLIVGLNKAIDLIQVSFNRDSDSYDFVAVYEAQFAGVKYAANLEYLKGQHRLLVTKDEVAIEDPIICKLGF